MGGEAERAMEQTEAAAAQAQAAIATARQGLDAEASRPSSILAIEPLRKRLAEVQDRLEPYKRVRTDFDERQRAGQAAETLAATFRAAETEADVVTALLSGPAPSPEALEEAERKLAPVRRSLEAGLREVQERLAVVAQGALHGSLSKAAEQGAQVDLRVKAIVAKLSEHGARGEGDTLTQQACEEVEKAEHCLALLSRAEAPWTKGGEVLPEAEATVGLRESEAAAAASEPVLEAARAVVAGKLAEAQCLQPGLVRTTALEVLQQLDARVDKVALRLAQFKVETFARRTCLQIPDVIRLVVDCEAKVKETVQAAVPLSQDNLETVTKKDLKAASKATLATEKVASEACARARKAISEKQQDPKASSSPSFQTRLLKLLERLDAAQSELHTQRAAANDCEASKAAYTAARAEVEKLEAEVAGLEAATVPKGDERLTEKEREQMAAKVVAAREAVATATADMASRAEVSPASLAAGLQRLAQRGRALGLRLDGVWELRRDVLEQSAAAVFAREARKRLGKVDASLGACEEKGEEVASKGLSSDFERSVTVARESVSGIRALLAARRADAARFASVDHRAATLAALATVVQDVDAAAGRLKHLEATLGALRGGPTGAAAAGRAAA